MEFTRFAETVETKSENRVVNISVMLLVSDCTGNIYFTDLQAQEGDKLTGYTLNTSKMLLKFRENSVIAPPRHYNGIVRSAATVILLNTGTLSAGLDCRIYPIQTIEAGAISVSQGAGAHKAQFLSGANAGDELELLSSNRTCKKNGSPTLKDGFYQYVASGDSKHNVKVQDRKSARVLFEFQETMEGGERF